MTSMIFFIVFVCILAALFLIINFLFAPHNPVNWFGKSIIWEKLSNSENILKFLILNCNEKVISGWINYSYKVISQKIIERKMDNCGSKSVIFHKNSIAVKEQRVNGNFYINLIQLRYTPIDFERNYKVKILFKQINIYRTSYLICKVLNSSVCPVVNSAKNVQLINPWWVTGFSDGEGCFSIIVSKNQKYKAGYSVVLCFSIGLHKNDEVLMKEIKNYFSGVGFINFKHGPNTIQYMVRSKKDLRVIIDHFDKYPLITEKWSDFQLLKQAFILFEGQEHLTLDGLKKNTLD